MRFEPVIGPEEFERYIVQGVRLRATYPELVDQNARLYPNREAFVDARRRVTYADLKRGVEALSAGLVRLGINPGDLIIAQVANCVEYFYLLYSLNRIGAYSMFITVDLRAQEIEQLLSFTEARGMVVHSELKGFDYPGMIQSLRPRLPSLEHVLAIGESVPDWTVALDSLIAGDPTGGSAADLTHRTHPPYGVTMVSSTSGTTGFPKVFPQVMPTIIGQTVAERTALTGDDVVLAMSPLRGGPANVIRDGAPFVGCKSILQETFRPEESLRLIEKERATVACGVPAQMIKILQTPGLDSYDLSSLRLFYFAGAAISPEVAEASRSRFGVRIIAEYGAQEAGPLASTRWDDPSELANTAIGRPMPGVTMRVVDERYADVPPGDVGEIVVKGPNVQAGGQYYRNAEAAAQALTLDGWFMTGDLGVLRPDGNFAIVGRRKDLIIRGGQNIVPREVEDLILAHPKVSEVAVVAYSDQVMGERAAACVVPRAGQTLTLRELTEFLRSKDIAAFKLPERLELLVSLPMVADGQKVNKNTLRQMIEQRER